MIYLYKREKNIIIIYKYLYIFITVIFLAPNTKTIQNSTTLQKASTNNSLVLFCLVNIPGRRT